MLFYSKNAIDKAPGFSYNNRTLKGKGKQYEKRNRRNT